MIVSSFSRWCPFLHAICLLCSMSNSLEATYGYRVVIFLFFFGTLQVRWINSPFFPRRRCNPYRSQLRKSLLFIALACSDSSGERYHLYFSSRPFFGNLPRTIQHAIACFYHRYHLYSVYLWVYLTLFALDSAYNGIMTMTLVLPTFLPVNASSVPLSSMDPHLGINLTRVLPLMTGPAPSTYQRLLPCCHARLATS